MFVFSVLFDVSQNVGDSELFLVDVGGRDVLGSLELLGDIRGVLGRLDDSFGFKRRNGPFNSMGIETVLQIEEVHFLRRVFVDEFSVFDFFGVPLLEGEEGVVPDFQYVVLRLLVFVSEYSVLDGKIGLQSLQMSAIDSLEAEKVLFGEEGSDFLEGIIIERKHLL